MKVGLVACSKTKLDRAAPARELYTSPLFRMSLERAQQVSGVVYVLSAFHGLVGLDQVLEPYDRKLTDLPKAARAAWGGRVVDQLAARHAGQTMLMAYAGAEYVKPIRNALVFKFGGHGAERRFQIVEPLSGLQVGQRLSTLRSWLGKEAA